MEEGTGRASKKTLALAGASTLLSLLIGHYLRSAPIIPSSAPIPPTASALIRTNRPATSALLNYPPPSIIPPPIMNPAWSNYAILQFSSNLVDWMDVPPKAIMKTNYDWVIYSSNFITHVVTPVRTNHYEGIWVIAAGVQSGYFFRWRGQ